LLQQVHHRLRIYDGPVPQASRDLERDGYAHVRGFLNADELAALRAEVLEVYERFPPDCRAGSPSVEHAQMFRYQMFNRSALAQRVSGHAGMLEIVEPLLGSDCHLIASTAWRNPADPAHAPRGQEWHSDAGPHIPRAPDVPWPENIPYPVFAIAVHFFLDDCGIDDGPTAVVPTSHRSGLPPPIEREWDLELDYQGRKSFPCLASAGDVTLFVSDVWHRRLPPTARSRGRFFLQTNYGRRDLAQRVLPTSEVNHTSPESRARATSERERLLIGLHPERFYDG
jgi:ectoine hydroxylase-related dioxygenase (phytanoyl-CoA dioxygenase family)